ncbi:MAG: glutamate racemase [Bdellovibrionota bacterium]
MRIGVFDSGIGGVTVLTELRQHFPGVDYVYLGDTANLPYGTKSAAHVERLSMDCARHLKTRKIDALIVACNTASSLALDGIKEVMGSTPVLGVVEPGVDAALAALSEFSADGGVMAPVLVLATRATVNSQAYGKILRAKLDVTSLPGRVPCPVIEQACPLLVPMIEEGWIDHPILHQTIAEYVSPHLRGQDPGVALLGCTHYPWIHAAFEKALPRWKVVNSASAVAQALATQGIGGHKLREQGTGTVEWIFTDPDAVPAFARKLIGI